MTTRLRGAGTPSFAPYPADPRDPWREAQTPPIVRQVVSDDGLSYSVDVALDPRDLLPAILRALGRHFGSAITATASDPASIRAIASDPAVAAALTLHLPPAWAEDLALGVTDDEAAARGWKPMPSLGLDDAATAPEKCTSHGCDRYGEVDHPTYGLICLADAASADEFEGVDREDWDEVSA